MSVTISKDFGPIRDDYLFFEEHATEAVEDARAYLRHLHSPASGNGPIRMLDFGCGSGRFTCQFLGQACFPPKELRLYLLEPEPVYRQQALEQLQSFTAYPVQAWSTLPRDLKAHFDLVLANHVFYYVPDLEEVLASILRTLSPSGLFLIAMAGRRNILIQFLYSCFNLINQPFPYHIAEDLELSLIKHREFYRKQEIQYELVFQDVDENRLKIMRFLLGNYFEEVPHQPMVDLFTPYAHSGRIEIRTVHEQFVIRRQGV